MNSLVAGPSKGNQCQLAKLAKPLKPTSLEMAFARQGMKEREEQDEFRCAIMTACRAVERAVGIAEKHYQSQSKPKSKTPIQ